MAKFCSNCGSEVQGTSRFCMMCGEAIAQAPLEQHMQTPQPYAPAPAAAKSKTPFIIAGAVVAAAALAVVLIVTDVFGLTGKKDVSVTAAVSDTAAPTDTPSPTPASTPEPTPEAAPDDTPWVDETKPNPDALFRLGMTRDELNGALALTGLAVAENAAGYIDAPPMFFGLADGAVNHISWDVVETGIQVPTTNGFTARSTASDLEQAMGRPLAACAEDESIMYLYQSGNQYVEVYFNWDSPFEISGFCVESSMENLHANPEYDDYDSIHERITGKGAAVDEENLTCLQSSVGRLAPEMPEWAFELYGKETEDHSFESIVLTISDENGRVVDSDVVPCTNGTVNDAHVLLADANFDGYMDVLYTEGAVGAHEHYWYNLRVWDPENKAFWYAEDFSEICNPVVDAKDKVIRSCGANSAFEDVYSIYVYKNELYYLDKKLVLTRDEVNGKENRTYEVYSYDTGEEKRIKTSKGSGQPNPNNPGEADFWGPKSTWKLDDSIWYESRHFQGAGE